MKELTRAEFAEIMEMSPETIRLWEDKLSIPVPRDARGYRVYTEKEKEIYETIKQLNEDHSFKSIQKIIQLNTEGIQANIQPEINEPIKDTPNKENSPAYNLNTASNELSIQLVSEVENKINSNTELSEMYGEVNQKLGFITALYLAEVEARKQERRLLIEGNDESVCNLKNSLDEKENQLKELQDKLSQKESDLKKEQDEKLKLKMDLESERKKTFLQRIFKK